MSDDQINFGVAGNPVSHSLSPVLFGKYVEDQGRYFSYTRILAKSTNEISRLIIAFDIKAINITSPFKEKILELADELSPYTSETGAANTLLIKEKTNAAFNTDISGVQIPLTRALKGSGPFSALVIGAGGAAKAAIKALKNMKISHVFISNRTTSKADILAEQFRINSLRTPIISKYKFDIVINTTPVFPEILNKLIIKEGTVLLDANYKTCPMIDTAGKYNARYINGIEWLAEQGRASYTLMTGIIRTNFIISQPELNVKNTKRIALTGMMGTGKTTIGKKLAEKLNYTFIDMDKLIQENEGQSITEIFEKKGEAYFRELEKELLKKIISRENIIISTGGGIVTDDENIRILKENCWNILLYGSPENLAQIASEKNRPLLAGKDKATELEKIFLERKDRYFRTSDVIVCSDTDTYHNISEFIYDDYSKSFLI